MKNRALCPKNFLSHKKVFLALLLKKNYLTCKERKQEELLAAIKRFERGVENFIYDLFYECKAQFYILASILPKKKFTTLADEAVLLRYMRSIDLR